MVKRNAIETRTIFFKYPYIFFFASQKLKKNNFKSSCKIYDKGHRKKMEFKKTSKTMQSKLVYPPLPEHPTVWEKFKLKIEGLIQVNETHPNTIEYFKSEISILREKKRHCENFKSTIHPLSKFNEFYEVWCFFFYGLLLFFKAFDFGFIRVSFEGPFDDQAELIIASIVLDLLSLMNICLQFLIGYTVQENRTIELSPKQIMLKYLSSGHFYCDLFSSIPRVIGWDCNDYIYLSLLTLTLLKLNRIRTFIKLIKPTAMFFGIRSSTNIFLLGFFSIVTLIMHIMTCFQVGIATYRMAITREVSDKSFVNNYLIMLPLEEQYIITFFRSAEYIFLIDVPHLRSSLLPEEVVLELVCYIVGKILFATVWIITLYTFMNKRALRLRFEEIMTELGEYMKAKQLPDCLKARLLKYYTYKYQKVFFNEQLIGTIFSDTLKKEIDVFLCKSLLKQQKIFATVPAKTIVQVMSYLVPQIYLPNDLVIQSGTVGDCMYFIGSGTVAVVSPSGKELCHLIDGDFFGEASLIIKEQKRFTDIFAIEASKIYMLHKTHFEKLFTKNDEIYRIFLETAKRRLEQTRATEVEYKKKMFDQIYKKD
ncbi:unnamed protein product [Ceutorhynchus assimilis]|uniref:Cyclic nucleotide-binding domain-containing protein n=1 Tax=Ceutorhynchus assimilis TaxID=467358 RepID=A0A9N9MZ79_9CUCU|nr:unnamed protein product [Ceutorhynchus assimilis]